MAWLAHFRTISQNAPKLSVPGQFFRNMTTSEIIGNCCTINKNIIVLANNALENNDKPHNSRNILFPFTFPQS